VPMASAPCLRVASMASSILSTPAFAPGFSLTTRLRVDITRLTSEFGTVFPHSRTSPRTALRRLTTRLRSLPRARTDPIDRIGYPVTSRRLQAVDEAVIQVRQVWPRE